MAQLRISVALPGLDAGELVAVAPAVEESGLSELWIGASDGRQGSTWTIAAAGAVSGVTRTLRLGVFVALGGAALPLHIAEDLGVLDSAAGGRVEVGFVQPAEGTGAKWEADVASIVTAWQGWQLPDGTELPVTPPPVQPFLPRVLVRPNDLAAATRLGAGIAFDDDHPPPDGVLRRTILLTQIGDVAAWLGTDPVAQITDLRRRGAGAGADTVLVELLSNDLESVRRSASLLGAIVAPGLRCADFQLRPVVESAWAWVAESF